MEDKENPLQDEEIVEELENMELYASRRTVSKYRKELNIRIRNKEKNKLYTWVNIFPMFFLLYAILSFIPTTHFIGGIKKRRSINIASILYKLLNNLQHLNTEWYPVLHFLHDKSHTFR